MKTEVQFTFDKVKYNQDNSAHMVVSLTAPKNDWETLRSPVCVVPVIDVSGSMTGNPLEYAKKSAVKLVEHLTETDYSGLVTFGSVATVHHDVVKMTPENKKSLIGKIASMRPSGGTNFSGGLAVALQHIREADMPEDLILRLIMLTDGHANVGMAVGKEPLSIFLKQNVSDTKISVSCFGYGEGADQDLLMALSGIGNGNYAFIETPDDALSAFAKELGGLLSTYAQNIKVKVKCGEHKTLETISDFEVKQIDDLLKFDYSEILSEEARHAVFKVDFAAQEKPTEIPFSVDVEYSSLDQDGKLDTVTKTSSGMIAFVEEGKEQDKPTKAVDVIVAQAELIKTQNRAEEFASQGNFTAAQSQFSALKNAYSTRDLINYSDFSDRLGAVFTSNTYGSSGSYLSSTKSALRRARGTSSLSKSASIDMKGLELADCDAIQSGMIGSFTSDKDESSDKSKV